ncbi:MAG: hypothetical protein ACYDH6_19845 [Acidimicrobiales bacterium]
MPPAGTCVVDGIGQALPSATAGLVGIKDGFKFVSTTITGQITIKTPGGMVTAAGSLLVTALNPAFDCDDAFSGVGTVKLTACAGTGTIVASTDPLFGLTNAASLTCALNGTFVRIGPKVIVMLGSGVGDNIKIKDIVLGNTATDTTPSVVTTAAFVPTSAPNCTISNSAAVVIYPVGATAPTAACGTEATFAGKFVEK